MGYYIRVLAEEDGSVSASEVREKLKSERLAVEVEVVDGSEQEWDQLVLRHKNGPDIALIERNPVADGELGQDELHEFIEETSDLLPQTGAAWLKNYLPSVKAIYAFQLLSGTDAKGGWEAVHAIQGLLWKRLGGILQADGEGFSNRDGDHIVWQFNDNAKGAWNMAVLQPSGRWTKFEMDLGNPHHRGAFLKGELPKGVKLL